MTPRRKLLSYFVAVVLLCAADAALAEPFACFKRVVTQQESNHAMTVNVLAMDLGRGFSEQQATLNAVSLSAQDAWNKSQSRYFTYLNPACLGDPVCKPQRMGGHNQRVDIANPCDLTDPQFRPYIEAWSGRRVQ